MSTADWRIHRDIPPESIGLYVAGEMAEELRRLGATFFRVTNFPSYSIVAVEGWRRWPDEMGMELLAQDVIGFGT